jgi:phage terminase small subunit
MAKLTDKQQRFVDEYLIDPTNQTQAAIRAGYPPKTACEQASRLLTNVKVKEAIEKEMAERAKRTGITKDRVLQEIAKIAFANMKDFVKWTPDRVYLIHSDELSDIDAAAIAEVSETIGEFGTSVKIKLHDKKGTLELLGRHLGLFNDKLDVNHKGAVQVVYDIPRNKTD